MGPAALRAIVGTLESRAMEAAEMGTGLSARERSLGRRHRRHCYY
jgi:hypothetical protein